ncbi:MAG: MFS transporter [Xanthomonadales bacterium]
MRGVPATVWRLTAAYILMMAGMPMMVLLAGIIGTEIAPAPELATLPIALAVVGVAASTLPTGRLLDRYGRRPVFVAYGVIAIVAALLAMQGLVLRDFTIFCLAAVLMGWSGAAGHQYRFAALESVPHEQAPRATSFLLLGGVFSAFIGPELAVRGRALLETEYAGSFLLLIGSYIAGLALIAGYRDDGFHHAAATGAGRPLRQIFRSPVIRIAVLAAALGYGVMSFIMTATPISMHVHAGHSLDATKFVIQSHIAAMYLPALAFPWLYARFGWRRMVWAGILIYAFCLAVALYDTSFLHYWFALVLLGVGWNFLFLSGTNLLPSGYRPEERFRVQSTNDFLVFSVQASVSLSAGWLLHLWHWQGIIVLSYIPLAACALLLLRYREQKNHFIKIK